MSFPITRNSVGLACGAVLVVVGASCGIPSEQQARELPPIEAVRLPTTTTEPPREVAPDTTERARRGVIVYYIRNEGLFGRAAVLSADYTVNELLELLVVPTSFDESNAGSRSGLAERADLVEAVEVDSGVVYVDLATSLGDLPGAEQVLIVGQLTLTFLANLPAQRAVFRQGGVAIAVPGADGQPIVGAAERGDFIALLART